MPTRDDSSSGSTPTDNALGSSSVVDLLAARRKRRLAALTAASGLWKDRTDIPADGVEYQRALRKEWDRDE
jgi:hypothetical protein